MVTDVAKQTKEAVFIDKPIFMSHQAVHLPLKSVKKYLQNKEKTLLMTHILLGPNCS